MEIVYAPSKISIVDAVDQQISAVFEPSTTVNTGTLATGDQESELTVVDLKYLQPTS